MNRDVINFEILADGTVKIENDKISPANHRAADELHRGLEKELGGAVQTNKKVPHSHHHDHQTHRH